MRGDTAIRRALLWWFRWPANPYVSLNASADFGPAREYLHGLNGNGAKVTVQHLLIGSLGRLLREFPQANARVVGRRILTNDHVAVAMPVNLLGHEGGKKQELSLAIVERADDLSLRAIAESCSGQVARERTGKQGRTFLRALNRFAESAPEPVLDAGLVALDRALGRPEVARRFFEAMPVSTLATNPGSTFALGEGALFRGCAFSPPLRLFQVGTIWGFSSVQDEVVPVDGRPEVRPMLPICFVFDHRLFDGVVASRILLRFAAILRDPSSEFGNG